MKKSHLNHFSFFHRLSSGIQGPAEKKSSCYSQFFCLSPFLSQRHFLKWSGFPHLWTHENKLHGNHWPISLSEFCFQLRLCLHEIAIQYTCHCVAIVWNSRDCELFCHSFLRREETECVFTNGQALCWMLYLEQLLKSSRHFMRRS